MLRSPLFIPWPLLEEGKEGNIMEFYKRVERINKLQTNLLGTDTNSSVVLNNELSKDVYKTYTTVILKTERNW